MTLDSLRQEIGALDKAEWTSWPHAYGSARDTPGHLAALLGDDEEAQAAAAYHFRSAIVHQSSVWPPSPDAFDWLIRVLAAKPLPAKVLEDCLDALAESAAYLGDIATGTPVPELSRDARKWLKKFGKTPDDEHELLWGDDEEVEEETYRWVLVRMAALRPSVAALVEELAGRAEVDDVRKAWLATS
jgi:hypothetical protein